MFFLAKLKVKIMLLFFLFWFLLYLFGTRVCRDEGGPYAGYREK